MNPRDPRSIPSLAPRCCPSPAPAGLRGAGCTRRGFLAGIGGLAASGMALPPLSWQALAPAPGAEGTAPARRPLRVKPILVYSVPVPRRQTSWRNWGGIQTEEHAAEESGRIRAETEQLRSAADFPVTFLPLSRVKSAEEVRALPDLAETDAFLVYAAGGWMDVFDALGSMGKDVILFVRHRSGPVYLWYEIISPRYLRQHSDELKTAGIDFDDVVVDSQGEILWRLRALAGLRNTAGSRIIAVGGPDGWAQPAGVVPALVEERCKLEIETLSYDDLGALIAEARRDPAAVAEARRRAGDYLSQPGTTLETDRVFVDNAFLLEQVFRALLDRRGCRALTINGCMGTIMPQAETSACLTLSLLNDAGYLAFCESDFVVIPSGLLLAHISGRPVFLNDPTFPHDGIITLAHCTAPRRMNGRELEPARILTHFESDYGAAPKVEMARGQSVLNIIPDFAVQRYIGLRATIEEAPFLDICRSQIDVRFGCDSAELARRMSGFHWMTGYGDFSREVGYALRRLRIEWEVLA